MRDVNGDLAWTRLDTLSNKQNVSVGVSGLKVRATADDAAAAGFIAEKNLVLEATESVSAGWTRVRHKDALSGYVRTTDVRGIDG
ncbi:MAG: SH3-like domain-containing protein [Janthinobacterium sp.]